MRKIEQGGEAGLSEHDPTRGYAVVATLWEIKKIKGGVLLWQKEL